MYQVLCQAMLQKKSLSKRWPLLPQTEVIIFEMSLHVRTYLVLIVVGSEAERSGATDGINQKQKHFIKKMLEKIVIFGRVQLGLSSHTRSGAARAG